MTSPIQNDPAPSSLPFSPALIVIDMQNDFVTGSLAVPDAQSVLEPINQLIDLPFKILVATRDFHPDNHISFAKTHQKPEFSEITIFHPEDKEKAMGIQQTLWPIHCVQYTGGADFIPGLKTEKFDAVIHKGTHASIESYSAFRDVWARKESELPPLLEENNISDLYIVGLAGDYCVKYTAIDAAAFGYNVWIVTDGVRCINEEEIAYSTVEKLGVKRTTLDEVKHRITKWNLEEQN